MSEQPSAFYRINKRASEVALKMINASKFLKQFQKQNNEEGQGLVEYALILFLVAVVVIAILILLGPQIGSVFSAVTKGFQPATPVPGP